MTSSMADGLTWLHAFRWPQNQKAFYIYGRLSSNYK